MNRLCLDKLVSWKNSKDRKPLVLQGARQVGKTYLLKHLGEKHFEKRHYFNFEKDAYGKIFEADLNPKRIIQELSLKLGAAINPERDLIIFDEIQECPKAITSLKYFCEDMPQSYICAAGSLLGLSLSQESFPVGKVEFLKVYPLDFEEFLLALGDERYVQLLKNFTLKDKSWPEIAHEYLWQRLKSYFVVGGLPAIVNDYVTQPENKFEGFVQARDKQENLLLSYFADIAKHSGKVNSMHIERVFRNIPAQLAQSIDGSARRFRFSNVIAGINGYERMSGAIDWLVAAGLVLKVKIAEKANLPLLAFTKENRFKLYFFDVGLLGAVARLGPDEIWQYDYGTYKGFFAENFIAQQLIARGESELTSWCEGSAEIEFVEIIRGKLLPIEVKSGHVTKSKSLSTFTQKYQPEQVLVLSAKNVGERGRKINLPLYFAGQVTRLFTNEINSKIPLVL